MCKDKGNQGQGHSTRHGKHLKVACRWLPDVGQLRSNVNLLNVLEAPEDNVNEGIIVHDMNEVLASVIEELPLDQALGSRGDTLSRVCRAMLKVTIVRCSPSANEGNEQIHGWFHVVKEIRLKG